MTTIDSIMALADDYADEKQISVRFSSGGFSTTMSAQMEVINKREALRTALTEALAAQPVREPDLSALSPKVQARIREWLADGTFVERAIGTMQEQERELMKHVIGGDK